MNNTTNPAQTPPSFSQILFTVLMMLIAFTGVVGNTLVIVAVIVNKKLRTSTNVLILNLSFADFFVCLVAIPLRVLTGVLPGVLIHIACPFILAVTILFDGASRLNTLLIALDRFVAIKWPFHYISLATRRVLFLIIFFGWAVTLSVTLLPLFGVGLETELTTDTICFFYNNLTTVFVCLFVLVFSIIPLVLIIPINCFLLRTSFKQMKEIYKQKVSLGIINPGCSAVMEAGSRNENSERGTDLNTITDIAVDSNNPPPASFRLVVTQSKVAKMVTVLIGSFVVLVTPISVIDLILVASPEDVDVPRIVVQTAVGMIYLNATINVFIYAGYNREFRKTIRFMFKRVREPFSSDVVPSSEAGVKFKNTVTKDQKYNIELLSFKGIQNL